MRINENTAISTSEVLLVPYSNHHVPTYHEWMKDPELQVLTASEPLALDEEYAMQRSWRTDRDKLTFIICSPHSSSPLPARILPASLDGPDQMLGDINLFLSEPEIETKDEGDAQKNIPEEGALLVGEIELMIARADQRKRGYGRSALLTFIDYVLFNWTQIAAEYGEGGKPHAGRPCRLSFLRVRINHTNTGSIRLFQSLGFRAISEEPNYFGELELRWQPDMGALHAQKSWEKHHVINYS